MNDKLISHSIDILENEVKIRNLWKKGFTRNPLTYYFTITYPPLSIAETISEKDVFHNLRIDKKKIALYFHIPFCSRKCIFCPYFSIVPNDQIDIDEYLTCLKKEASLIKRYLKDNIEIEAIYIGGGTPTILTPEQLNDLLEYIRNEFNLSKSIEITVEVHPEVTRMYADATLDVLKKNKVNRISIGIQTFDDSILSIIGRGHSAEDSIILINKVKRIGFPNVVIDMLYGLPDQTIGSWLKDLEIAYDLSPDGVTTYYAEIRDWTKIYHLYKKEPYRFPNEYLSHLFNIIGIEKAKQEGYRQNPIMYYSKRTDHFRYASNVFSKSEEGMVIGLGISAYSWVNGYQYFNHHDFKDYYQSIQKGQLPIWKGTKLSLEDRMARMVMLDLRLSSSISKNTFELVFGQDINEVYRDLIIRLKKLNLIQEYEKKILPTLSGILFIDELCTQFVPQIARKKLIGLRGKFDRFYRLT